MKYIMRHTMLKANYLFACCCLLALPVSGQQRKADSLRIGQLLDSMPAISNSNTDSAMGLVDTVMALAKRHGLKNSEVAALINKGILFKIQGNYDSAAFYHVYARNVAAQLRDTISMVRAYVNIGLVYELQRRYDLALQSYQDAERLLKPTDTLSYAKLYNNMGIAYKKAGDIDKGLTYYQKSARLNEAIGNSRDLALNYNNMAIIYRDRKEYGKALTNFHKALKINEALGSKVAMASNYINLSSLYGMQDNYALALDATEKAYELAGSVNAKREMADALHNMEMSYAGMGDYKSAYEKATEYYLLKDSLLNERTTAAIAELDKKYNKAKQEQTIATLEKNRTLQTAALGRQRNTLIWMSATLILVVVFSVFTYRNLLNNKKHSQALAQKNNRIETLIRELHHRVKNNMQVVSSLLSLQSLRMEEGKAKEAVAEGQRRMEAMALIHQKLYQQEAMTWVDMKAYVSELVQHLIDGYGTSLIELKIEADDIELDIDTAVPLGLIINELITNSLKYGIGRAAGDKLFVGLYDLPSAYQLTLADNGPGFPDGFNIATTGSFGLKLVNTLVRQLRATITWRDHAGAAFEVFVPKLKRPA